jgi:LuxR family maltose regulon positive regulatory protein
VAKQQLAKLTPPRLSQVFLRTRLFERITDALASHPVIWIGAPAGAGKTTLVTSYLQEQSVRPLYYSVDAGDMDPASFFYYLGLAAKHVGLRKTPPLYTPEYQQGLPVFTRNYFRDLLGRLKKPAVLVFDNFQESSEESGKLGQILHTGLEELPADVRVFIISRARPPAELSRLLAGGIVAQFDWDDLRLDESENRALIATLLEGRPPDTALAQELFAHTRGWITGVVLALRNRARTGTGPPGSFSARYLDDHEQMFDYFASEVLSRTDASTRELLAAVSVLPAMTERLCERLTGNRSAWSILQKLEKNYFFITRRGKHNAVYEFHPLFRTFLLERLAGNLTAVELVQLRHKAARLLEADGQVEQAIELYLQAGDWAETTRLVCQHAMEHVSQGRGAMVSQWIRQVPDAVLAQTPWLQFWLGVSRMLIAPKEGGQRLEQAYWQFKALDDVPGMCLSLASIVESFSFGWQDFYPLDGWIIELESLLAAHPELPSPELRARMAVTMFVALVPRRPNHPEMEHWIQQAREVVRRNPDANQRVITGMYLANYYVWWGRHRDMALLLEELRPLLAGDEISPMGYITFHAAEAMYYTRSFAGDALGTAQAALDRAEQSGVYAINLLLLGFAAIASMHAGDLDAAGEYQARCTALLHPERLMDQGGYHWVQGHLEWLRGDIPRAIEHARLCIGITRQLGSSFHDRLAPLTLAKMLVEAGEYRESGELLESTLPAIREIENPALEYECLLVMARSAFLQHKDAEGRDALRHALQIMRKIGAESTIWWNPRWITSLLMRALEADIEVDFVQSLIRGHGLLPGKQDINTRHWPWPLMIRTLGQFSLCIDGRVLDISGKSAARPIDLLKCLIAQGGRHVAQERLIQELWPELEGDAGAQTFSTTLYRLRKLIAYNDAIVLKHGLLSLDDRFVQVDTWVLEQTINRLDRALQVGQKPADIERLSQQLMHGYPAPFLDRDHDPSWAIACREKLQLRVLHCLKRLGRYWQGQGRYEPAITAFERILELDGLHEAAYRYLMQVHLRQGHHADAAITYQRCRKALAGGLGVMPSTETLAVYRQIHSGE